MACPQSIEIVLDNLNIKTVKRMDKKEVGLQF